MVAAMLTIGTVGLAAIQHVAISADWSSAAQAVCADVCNAVGNAIVQAGS